MQVKRFETGGFVIHKASLQCSKLTFPVWCDERGQILDIDAFNSSGKRHGAFTVKRAKGEVGQSLKLLCFRIAQSGGEV